jgi:FtsZ-binding cell division protein ZapB
MTHERDPIIEIADLREANQQWKDHCDRLDEHIQQARRDLIMLARRNTLLVIEIEDLKEELAKLKEQAKPISAKFDEVKAMNDRLGPLASLEECAKDSYRSENSQ